MTEAKYHVGQLVAVCTSDLSVVIPETRVVARNLDPCGFYRDWRGNLAYLPSGWAYQVADARTNPRGGEHWFAERCLRPIDKDEYTDSDLSTQPQDKESA
jgi:hypothetical protein